jgi:hypothetical protein
MTVQSITIPRRIKEVFESYRTKFKEKKEKKNNRSHPSVSGTKTKTLKPFFFFHFTCLQIFSSRVDLEPNPYDQRETSLQLLATQRL